MDSSKHFDTNLFCCFADFAICPSLPPCVCVCGGDDDDIERFEISKAAHLVV